MANYYSAKEIKNVTPMVLYNVGYIDGNGKEAEVQFKVHAWSMIEEMPRLFTKFCRENGCDPKKHPVHGVYWTGYR